MNVALIGCGTLGTIHSDMMKQCGLSVVVCADIKKTAATTLAKRCGAEATTDCLATVERDDVDIVFIATPTPNHVEYVLAAAKAKKHIFCEKPFALTVADCKKAIAAAKKAKVKLFVAHVVRYFHEFEAIKASVDGGAIGKVGMIRTYRCGSQPIGADGWFLDEKRSGGVVIDLSIHDIDWIRYTFGDVERVFCQRIKKKMAQAGDMSMLTLRLKNGAIATVTGSWAHPPEAGFVVKTELVGDAGMVEFDSSNDVPLKNVVRRDPKKGGGTVVPASPVQESPYKREWEDFLAWIQEDRTPRVTAEDAMEAIRIAVAANKSAATGKPVRLTK